MGIRITIVGQGSSQRIVMAGRVPATHAPAVVLPPQRSHRLGAGGRDTPGHDGEGDDGERIRLRPAPAGVRDALQRRTRASAPPEGSEGAAVEYVLPAGPTLPA